MDGLGARAERAGGVDDVVGDDRALALDLADDRGDARLAVLGAQLRDDRDLGVEHLGEARGQLGAARIGGDDDGALAVEAHVAEVAGEHRQRRHVVHGAVEEALHLPRVEIHRQHAVDTGGAQQRRDEARGDRLARRGLLVLARVRVPRDDGGDALGRAEHGRVGHDHQLHQVAVDRIHAALDEEDVGAAHRLLEARVDLAVGERLQRRAAERDTEAIADALGEVGVGAAGEHHQALGGGVLERGQRRAHLGGDVEQLGIRHRASSWRSALC